MTNQAPRFDEKGRLIAPGFDDVYFSADDGLAETRHVFLRGNQLAQRFAAMTERGCFKIGETGFGTGLNFIAAWHLFEQHAPADARLEFVSVEGFPLDRQVMGKALEPWPELASYAALLLTQWGPLWPGVHRLRLCAGRVRLTLLVGDVVDVLSAIDARVDAWFLDGFAPARNPAMWSDEVFTQVARLSAPGATLATYTAAGFVRRGLQSAGFEINKCQGFGTKRDMTVGRWLGGPGSCRDDAFAEDPARQEPRPPDTRNFEPREPEDCSPEHGDAVVIGASLAGAFAARSLAERGFDVTVLDRQAMVDGQLPSMISRVSVLQPKISDADDPAGRWLREGFAYVQRLLKSHARLADRANWWQCGTFQAAVDDRTERRLRRFVEQFAGCGLVRWIDAKQTESELGLALPVGGAVVDSAGALCPAGLCAALLDHERITTRCDHMASSLERDGHNWTVRLAQGDPIRSSRVVVANALDALHLEQIRQLDLKPVRGQVTLLRSADQAGRLTPLRRVVFYGGYITPAMEGVHTLGASFVPGDDSLVWRDQEHQVCCDQLARLLPEDAAQLRCLAHAQGWVGLRVATPTHRAYARQVDDGLYVSLGHGSHGIASAAAAGEHLASLITSGVRVRGTR